MKIKYEDLIHQTFDFPQEEFEVEKGSLRFHGIPLMSIIEQYGTPLKLTYLPKISHNIQQVKKWFAEAMEKVDYQGNYQYCYCTKSSHFEYVVKEALKNDIFLETSSAFDIDIIRSLHRKGAISKDLGMVCNGFKTERYMESIADLLNQGFGNIVPVIDNFKEWEWLMERLEANCDIGIRIASEEEPKFEFYTSRLGIGYKHIVPFYKNYIANNPKVNLSMLHFFVNTGIHDTAYYWSEFLKCLRVYVALKKICPTLKGLNIGGGLPVKDSLGFSYDYAYMIGEIVAQTKAFCKDEGVEEPDLYTEFGSYTVAESGANIYSVLYQKQQNDREKWNIIDSSFMTTLPDSWGINRKFVMLPVNHWTQEYERVFLGGLTCDSDDYYNSEQHVSAIYLPKYVPQSPLYIGFFHTGAYQDNISGYGGIQHCLIPKPKHILIDYDEEGELRTRLFSTEQSSESMMRLLGYGE